MVVVLGVRDCQKLELRAVVVGRVKLLNFSRHSSDSDLPQSGPSSAPLELDNHLALGRDEHLLVASSNDVGFIDEKRATQKECRNIPNH